ncbi:hypothetical protein EXIGLDRAFT_840786 [Exidia glandulosa HHB12029]|uniref:Uncharacterized protein n=1 Tax=Exidia glandulosa HHB12029 TaxID=1314781 RepID=A0A165EAB5_EXIGL|nr:hypothetical protein EXIGLDRAFT_840786 [Exidia glandulosa HHB12029]
MHIAIALGDASSVVAVRAERASTSRYAHQPRRRRQTASVAAQPTSPSKRACSISSTSVPRMPAPRSSSACQKPRSQSLPRPGACSARSPFSSRSSARQRPRSRVEYMPNASVLANSAPSSSSPRPLRVENENNGAVGHSLRQADTSRSTFQLAARPSQAPSMHPAYRYARSQLALAVTAADTLLDDAVRVLTDNQYYFPDSVFDQNTARDSPHSVHPATPQLLQYKRLA